MFNKNGKNYIKGPFNGEFINSLLPKATYFRGHKTSVLEVKLTDDFGNHYKKLVGSCYDLGLSARSDKYMEFLNCKQQSDKTWIVYWSVCVPGEYKIMSPKLPYTVYAIVRSSEPSAVKSSCTIEGHNSTPNIVVPGGKVKYVCSLRDKDGNAIDTKKAMQAGVQIKCSGKNTTYGQDVKIDKPTVKKSSFECEFKPTSIGTNVITGSFALKDGSFQKIPSTINTVNGLFEPKDIQDIWAYNFTNYTWYKLRDIKNILMNHSSPYLTQILFVDHNGKAIVSKDLLYNFDIGKVTAVLYNLHDSNYKKGVKVNWVAQGPNSYVGFSIDDNSWVKKSSAEYRLEISYNGKKNYIRIQKPPGFTRGQAVCIHVLDAGKTNIFGFTSPQVKANVDTYLGRIYLKTKDNYLYNYRVDKKRFTFNVPDVYVKEDSVDGMYDVRIATTKAGTKSFEGFLDGKSIFKDLSFKVLPDPFFAKFTSHSSNKFKDQAKFILQDTTADKEVKINFTAQDKYGNTLQMEPSSENKYLGLNLDVQINGIKQQVNFEKENMEIEFDDGYYTLEDEFKLAGKYKVTMKGASGDLITFSYSKNPGAVDLEHSFATVSTVDVDYGKKAKILLVLRDSYNNAIQYDSTLLTNELKNIKVKAKLVADDKVIVDTFTKSEHTKEHIVFTSNNIVTSKIGKFGLQISYKDDEVSCPRNCGFTVAYRTFHYPSTKMFMMIGNTQQITTKSEAHIKNGKGEQPIFRMQFFDEKKVQLMYVDQKTVISAKIVDDKNTLKLALKHEWKGRNEMVFELSADDKTKGKFKSAVSHNKYFLEIHSATKKEISYPLKLFGDKEDKDAGNGDPDYKKTVYDAITKTTIAGKEISYHMELRTKDNLRCNLEIKPESFKLEESSNLSEDKFAIEIENGAKKGQFIINVMSKKTFFAQRPCLITVSRDSQICGEELELIVKNAQLSYMDLYNRSFKDEDKKILKDAVTTRTHETIFYPRDTYGNLYTDLFDRKKYSIGRITSLFSLTHSVDGPLQLSARTYYSNFRLKTISRKIGVVTLTSKFLKGEKYTFTVFPGPAYATTSIAKLMNTDFTMVAGETAKFDITPLDKYQNIIPLDTLTDSDYKKFSALVGQPRTKGETAITKKEKGSTGAVEFSMALNEAGANNFAGKFAFTKLQNCRNCQLTITNAPISYPHSELYYEEEDNSEERISTKAENIIDHGKIPTFNFYLADQYSNRYAEVPKDMVLTAKFKNEEISLDLCAKNVSTSFEITLCPGENNRLNWIHLISERVFTLTISKKVGEGKTEDLQYKVKLTGGPNNSDASNGPVDPNKTFFSVEKIDTIAGKYFAFNIELRTKEGKRKNFNYPKPSEKIQVIRKLENDAKHYGYQIESYGKPGQYRIKIMSEKKYLRDAKNTIQIKLLLKNEWKLCETTVLPYFVFNDVPLTGELVNINDTAHPKIEALPAGNADFTYTLGLRIFDKFNNIADFDKDKINFEFTTPASSFVLQPVVVKNSDFTYFITVKPTLAGGYSFKTNYLNKGTPAKFSVACGKPHDNTSLLIAPEKSVAGEEVKVYIIPFDVNGNYVDPNKLKSNPYKLAYKYTIEKDNLSNYFPIALAGIEINTKQKKAGYFFRVTLIKRDENFFKATLGEDKVIKAVNSMTTVAPAAPVYEKFLFETFNPTLKKFVEMEGVITIPNKTCDPILRIWPRDRFLNSIDVIQNLDVFTALATDVKGNKSFLLNTKVGKKNLPYVEIKKDPDTNRNKNQWHGLVKGKYDISFTKTDEKLTVKRDLYLAGDKTDSDADNSDVDYQKTVINEKNLSFKAGETGHIIIELKTVTGMRRNYFGYKVELKSGIEDKTFAFKTKEAGKPGVYFVEVTTNKANNFPSPGSKFPFSILIDGNKVEKLTPQLDISPSAIHTCAILNLFLDASNKNKEINVLKTGTADKALFFKVQCKDEFLNICMGDAEVLKIALETPNKEVLEFDDGKEVLTGLLTYTVPSTLAGNYIFNADTKYMKLPVHYTCLPGALNRAKTDLVLESKEIVAGGKAYLLITPKDQHSNIIPAKQVITDFETVVISESQTPFKATSEVFNQNVRMTVILTERDRNVWNVIIMKKPVQCPNCITNVLAGSPNLKNTSVYMLHHGKVKKAIIANQQKITFHNTIKIAGTIILRDNYQNIIPKIDEKQVSFKAVPVLSGMHMVPITFATELLSTKASFSFEINFKDMLAYNHLVAGSEYQLAFTLHNATAKADYAVVHPVNLLSNTDDTGHGNGPYVIDQTHLSKTSLEIHAGDKEVIDLTLKTAQGLIYNRDVPLDSIKSVLDKEDKSFTWEVAKKPETTYAIYTIVVSSTKLNNKPALKIDVTVEKKKVPTAITFKVNPAKLPSRDRDMNKIIKKPLPKSKWDQDMEFLFQLFDKYGNQYEDNKELIKFTFIRRGDNVVKTQKSLQKDQKTYSYVLEKNIEYPPRWAFFELYFDNGVEQYVLSTKMVTFITSEPYPFETQFRSNNVTEMKAGEKLDFRVFLFDKNKFCIDTENGYPLRLHVTGPLEIDQAQRKTIKYNFVKKEKVLEPSPGIVSGGCKQYYEVDAEEGDYSKLGTYSLDLYAGQDDVHVIPEVNGKKEPIVQKIVPDDLDVSKFLSKWTIKEDFDAMGIVAGRKITFDVLAHDRFMNRVSDRIEGKLKLEIMAYDHTKPFEKDTEKGLKDYNVQDEEIANGQLSFTVTIRKAGPYRFNYKYDNNNQFKIDTKNGPNDVVFIPGSCSLKFPILDVSQVTTIFVGDQAKAKISCYDQFNNKIGKGGENFAGIVTVYVEKNKLSSDVKSKIVDNKDGTYFLEFLPQIEGRYDIIATLNAEKYGATEKVEIKNSVCPPEKPNKCPNNPKICASTPYDCIEPKNNCPKVTPFYCKRDGILQCLPSQKMCDCPDGYIRCPVTNVCIEKDKRNLCPFNLPINCPQLYPASPYFCPDGICRKNKKECNNERVCPIGFIMCVDLSCRKDYSQCFKFEPCGKTDLKCMDQTCVRDQKDCPNSITCAKISQKVCPNGTCVDNEVFCSPLPVCNVPNNILCNNNTCVSKIENCPKSIACEHEKALCEDVVCKDSCNKEALRYLLDR